MAAILLLATLSTTVTAEQEVPMIRLGREIPEYSEVKTTIVETNVNEEASML